MSVGSDVEILQGNSQGVVRPKKNPYYDELDLVDAIAFVWSWRRLIAGSILAGALFASLFNYLKTNAESRRANESSWSVSYKLNQRIFELTTLTNLLKSNDGVSSFREGLPPQLSDSQMSVINDWIAKFSETNPPARVYSELLYVTLNGTNLDADQGSVLALQSGLNSVISRFNERIESISGRIEILRQDRISSLLELSSMTAKSMNLYGKYSGLSPTVTKDILTQYTSLTNGQQSGDGILFLLGPVPSQLAERQDIVKNFDSVNRKLTVIDSEIASSQKLLSMEAGIRPLPAIGDVKSISKQNAESFRAPVLQSTNPLAKLPFALAFGIVSGAVIGFFLAAILQFYKSNAIRLKMLTKKPD